MNGFKYKVSVIVPVYNVEKYLRGCLDSLLAQTIDQTQMEILLINDGSTDDSLFICEEYAKIFSVFKLFSKENEGLSATRNYGVLRAQGKYLMYLDSDDTFTPETIQNVTDFFDTVYDQVDVVTYPIQPYRNGKKLPQHFRYNYLKKTGVYELNEFPFITQTNINVCVKNNGELFDTTPGFHQEDQEYICRLLKPLGTIGFVKDAEYQYNRNESSITSTLFNPIELFESSTKYFEDMFNSFEGNVPRYYQAMLVNDLQWKLKSNILYPYHYEVDRFAEAMDRIVRLLEKVDDDVIYNHPDIDSFHKAYWLSVKPNHQVTVYGNDTALTLLSNGKAFYRREKVELVLYRICIRDGVIKLLLSAKSPVFNFTEMPRIIAVITRDGITSEKEMELFESSWNYYHCKEKTNRFWSFYFEKNAAEIDELYFVAEVDGLRYQTNYYFMDSCPFNLSHSVLQYAHGATMIRFFRNVFYFEPVTEDDKKTVWRSNMGKFKNADPSHSRLFELAVSRENTAPIWLYYDCKGVEKHNGYYQFIHDLKQDDGIERYYISANPREQYKHLFTEDQLKHVVEFKSLTHKILFINADRILTAYIEEGNINPFDKTETEIFKHLFHAEIIYLQHGVLHASVPWKYSPERVAVDRVVISSFFEERNFTANYGFRKKDLIYAGMPCLDYLHSSETRKNRILFAPSWRLYLINQAADGSWIPTDSRFLDSEYYMDIQRFLNHPKLAELLEKNGLYLDFKIHPIFAPYREYFHSDCHRVSIAGGAVDDSEYGLFITDFSSYVFNFAYLKCPILYYVPDMLQFRAGLNQYRSLDLPFEEAFGELTETAETAIAALESIVNRNMQASDLYKTRMERFFLPAISARDSVYHALDNNE